MTSRQEKFVRALVLSGNYTQAAVDAGYTKTVGSKKAFKWVGKSREESEYPEMYDLYVKLMKREQERLEKKYDMDKAFVKKVLKPILEAKITDYFELKRGKVVLKDFKTLTEDQVSAIESIKPTRYGIEIKLHGKSWSTESIAKHLGFYEADNSQQAGKTKILIEMPDNARTKSEDKK